ncbi:hypothetical protein RhiirA1_454027 [Rhizophagus irregularis]|uniref:Uncharacterized protein n=1 Tax=Rhizophagus irregularis TaxID=588596 RepID=A0A2N0S624_9GLOM|nr:hypothetical protein RhiirA1_454027 [Rhizophagus irregularis]
MKIYAPSKNENVSLRQNIFELIVPQNKDMRLSNLEPLKGESESLKHLIDDENLPPNESQKIGFQITKEILGYLNVEDLISRNYDKHCTKNYHQDLVSSIIKGKRKGNEEIEEEEDTDDDANGSMNFIEK